MVVLSKYHPIFPCRNLWWWWWRWWWWRRWWWWWFWWWRWRCDDYNSRQSPTGNIPTGSKLCWKSQLHFFHRRQQRWRLKITKLLPEWNISLELIGSSLETRVQQIWLKFRRNTLFENFRYMLICWEELDKDGYYMECLNAISRKCLINKSILRTLLNI